ncbi:MAG: hypothetical protein ACJ75H_10860, partial [Thermoanaerobaculia bacterium]
MKERDGALVSAMVFLLLVGSIAGLIYLGSLLAHGPVGIALQAAAFLLMVWARITFGRRSF